MVDIEAEQKKNDLAAAIEKKRLETIEADKKAAAELKKKEEEAAQAAAEKKR